MNNQIKVHKNIPVDKYMLSLFFLTRCFITPLSCIVRGRERQEDESKWKMSKQQLIFILVGNKSDEIVDRRLLNNKRDKGM